MFMRCYLQKSVTSLVSMLFPDHKTMDDSAAKIELLEIFPKHKIGVAIKQVWLYSFLFYTN